MKKKAENKKSILVYADWVGFDSPVKMGILHSERIKGKEIFSFEYAKGWLQTNSSRRLDPELLHYSGLQYKTDERKNFGVFLDSSPDRWGRLLMRRKESALAKAEKREEKRLFETDYLLGVYDGHRMGGLRFKLTESGPFLNDDTFMRTPPWTSIRELESISLKLEEDDVMNDPEYINWLNMLISPGSSLGGARPKASISDEQEYLWIAKFPSKNDLDDIGGWEIVTYELALNSGINMAESKAEKFYSDKYTFLSRRFDKTNHGQRIHFASAMTALGYSDGDDYSDGISYLELVEFIQNNGANIAGDLEQLWRRIVFSICVSNTDDHLRNHGFLLSEHGWILSPAFDLNPNEYGIGLKLNITENDNSLDLGLALDVAAYFRLDKDQANEIMNDVKRAVQNWKAVANKYGISRREQELKSRAFNKAF